MIMDINNLGFAKELSDQMKKTSSGPFIVGRITQEHRERYIVSTGDQSYEAEITGNLRFTARSRSDFPAVGDWVNISVYDKDQAIIHEILPRRSVLERRAAGNSADTQIIATNIDVAFIIQALNNNFNMNRFERYMSLCYSSHIEPVLVLSKIDLVSDQEIVDAVSILKKRAGKVRHILLSNTTMEGLSQLMATIEKGMTYCVVGSSGVGKSTLINNLLRKNTLKTGEISTHTNKGRHITEHRELFVLENGGIIIDTPGMKEVGMTDNPKGITTAFQEIIKIGRECKFHNCNHINDEGCAVLEALDKGNIDRDSYNNFIKTQKEQARFRTTIAEKRKKEKGFGKMLKNYHKDINRLNKGMHE
jgi:ribosome biogenesis GTPase